MQKSPAAALVWCGGRAFVFIFSGKSVKGFQSGMKYALCISRGRGRFRLNVCRMTCLVLKTEYFQACFYYHGVADRVCLLILQSVLVHVLTAYLSSLSRDYRYGMYIGMTRFFSRIGYLKIIICLTICLYFTRAVADRNYKCVFATFFINPVNFLPCPV